MTFVPNGDGSLTNEYSLVSCDKENVIIETVKKAEKSFDVDAHHAVARRCAEESIVLLDNDGILPLTEGDSVAVIGDFAKTPRYQGAGSSRTNCSASATFT